MEYGTYPVSTRAMKPGECIEHPNQLASLVIGQDNPDLLAFGNITGTEYENHLVTALENMVQTIFSGNGSGTLTGGKIGVLSGELLY